MQRLLSIGLIGALVAAASTAAFAQSEPVPFITTEELKPLMAAAPKDWKHVLIDTRARVEFSEGRIKGAINLPAGDTERKLGELVKDKLRLLIFYCNGPRCTKSSKGAKAALALGYSNVKIYNEGLPAWAKARLPQEGSPFPAFEAETISPQALQTALSGKPAPLLIDVRDAVEYEGFHIAGSRSLPLDQIADHLAELPAEKVIYLVD
ncbi:MAG: hypothetical protein HY901_34570, partial [Deltaproteobacteria bacterium]|nr:hypothetical protein [Deltaproteobacteria bacterium]